MEGLLRFTVRLTELWHSCPGEAMDFPFLNKFIINRELVSSIIVYSIQAIRILWQVFAPFHLSAILQISFNKGVFILREWVLTWHSCLIPVTQILVWVTSQCCYFCFIYKSRELFAQILPCKFSTEINSFVKGNFESVSLLTMIVIFFLKISLFIVFQKKVLLYEIYITRSNRRKLKNNLNFLIISSIRL